MKFGDLLIGTITRFDDKGRGVFDLERPNAPLKPVCVPFTTIGDVVEVRMLKRDKGNFITDLVRVITPGPDRIPYPSPTLEQYPGGLWMHIAYDAQIRFKRDMIHRAFEGAGHEERVSDVIPSTIFKHFRNRMDYAVSWDNKIGLKEFGSWNRYRDITEDPLLSDASPKILDVFRRLLNDFDLKAWDNKRYEGDLRYVSIREGKNTNERLICAIVKDASRVTDEMKAFLLRELDELATSIVIGENPLITDLSVVQTIIPIKGDGTLNEIVNGTKYHIHLNSFFQTNPVMAATLQDVVADLVRGASSVVHSLSTDHEPRTTHILDLYCGLGFFGINLAQRDPLLNISGFEIDAQAIELAKENAAANGVADRTEFTSGPAEDLSWKQIDADLVILDPPRAGLHPRVVKTILEKKPKTIIYVSCNFHRLVNELKQLKTAYRIEALQAIDMFPHTPHVEVVTKLVLV